MELIDISGHTICPEKLSDGVIIDIGCRSFNFTSHPLFNGKKKYCIDPDEDIFSAESGKFYDQTNQTNLCLAISDKTGETTYYPNGEATMIREVDPDPTFEHIDKKYSKKCKTITMDDLYEITGKNVDVLKLDCEGAEYIILGETFKPIPKQITCEFHHHCVPELHKQKYQEIIERLSEHYEMHNAVWEQRHGCGYNFWDTLFIKKDLVGGADDVDRTLIEIC